MTQQRINDDASMSSHRTRTNTRAQQITEADAVEAISASRIGGHLTHTEIDEVYSTQQVKPIRTDQYVTEPKASET